MKYRKFGRLEWKSSVLGFGVMRLPRIRDGVPSLIDEAESVRMIRYAVDRGANYLDLSFPWDIKQQEAIIRVARNLLRDGYLEKVRVALAIPAFHVKSAEDLDRELEKQLAGLGEERVDFCILGRLNRENWPKLRDMGALTWAEGKIREGRFKGLGFSFHDHYQVLRDILDDYDRWTLCSFRYSYMDFDHDPGISGINYAAARGLAVVITEALRGGRLTRQPFDAVADAWASAPMEHTLAQWGLRFVWNHKAVSTVVCDMSSMEQVMENLGTAENAAADSMSVQEELLISRVRDAFRSRRQVPCPSCRLCMPCPVGIDVPRFFEILNDAVIYEDSETARTACRNEQLHPEDCTECRLCERRCAKRIPIVDWLNRSKEFLANDV